MSKTHNIKIDEDILTEIGVVVFFKLCAYSTSNVFPCIIVVIMFIFSCCRGRDIFQLGSLKTLFLLQYVLYFLSSIYSFGNYMIIIFRSVFQLKHMSFIQGIYYQYMYMILFTRHLSSLFAAIHFLYATFTHQILEHVSSEQTAATTSGHNTLVYAAISLD